jgi:hypothetical protein
MRSHWLLKPIRYVYYRVLIYKMRDTREVIPVMIAGYTTTLLLVFNCMLVVMTVMASRVRAGPLLPYIPRTPANYFPLNAEQPPADVGA